MEHILNFEKTLNKKFGINKNEFKIDEKKWITKNKRILNNNIKIIQSLFACPNYKTTYNLIKNRIEILELLLCYFHKSVTFGCRCKNSGDNPPIFWIDSNNQTLAPLFWISYDEIHIYTGKKREIIASSLLLFNLLGLVYKLKNEQVPDCILGEGEAYKRRKHYNYHMNYYYVPPYNKTLFDEIEKRAIKLKKLHFSLKSANRQWVLRTLGTDYADVLYPQHEMINLKGTSIKSNKQTKKLIDLILKSIQKKGYIFQNQLSDNPQWGISKHEILEKYNLVCKYANKETKKRFNISKNGYIIYKE